MTWVFIMVYNYHIYKISRYSILFFPSNIVNIKLCTKIKKEENFNEVYIKQQH